MCFSPWDIDSWLNKPVHSTSHFVPHAPYDNNVLITLVYSLSISAKKTIILLDREATQVIIRTKEAYLPSIYHVIVVSF
jgi:hypothetical protein